MDGNVEKDNFEDRYDVIMRHVPAGTSIFNMKYWQQLIFSNEFEKFDYGSPEENMQHYNQTTPPIIDLKNINFPEVHLFGGNQDELANTKDFNRLFDDLSNSANATL